MNLLNKHSSSILIVLLGLLSPFSYTQQPLLQITSPTTGALVTEGTILTVTVSADSSVQIIGVLTDGPFPDLQAGSSSNQFLQAIPTTIRPGVYHLTAIGANSTGDVESDPVAIDVERQFFPNSIVTAPSVLSFTAIGNRLPIQVTGTFSDGTKLDVTRSRQMVFTSNNTQIATVSSSGIVTAVGPGQTSILVQAGSISFPTYTAVLVSVPQPAPTGTAPVITSVTPTSGVPGTTQVTVAGSGFGAVRGSGVLLLGTRYATAINHWDDGQIVATIPAGSRNGFVEVGQNSLYSNDVALAMNVPIIESVSPAILTPGMQMTLTGSGFGATQGSGFVYFGYGAYGAVTSWDDTRIVVMVPSGIFPGTVEVVQNGVASNNVNYTMVPPGLASILPTALLPGIQMTLHGTGFGATAGNGFVYFGYGAFGTVLNWGDAQIDVTVPSGISPGTVEVVQNGVASNSLNYTMVPPVLSSLSSSVLVPGTQVTLNGNTFGATQGNGFVYFGYGVVGDVLSWQDQHITVTVPSGLSGQSAGSVEVVANGVASNLLPYTVGP